MAFIEFDEFSSEEQLLHFHFDVNEHRLKLETFIRTAQSANGIVSSLNSTLFQSKLNFEIVIIPPEPGSFLSRLYIHMIGGAAAVFAMMETDMGAAYVEGLTGENPSYWTKKLGEEHRGLAEESVLWKAKDNPDPELLDQTSECKISSVLLTEMTRGFLEKSPEVLNKIGVDIGDLPQAVADRNSFYLSCMEDPSVKAIGFDTSDDFPIPRSLFPEQARLLPKRDEDELVTEWEVSIEDVFVTSPNWDKNDQQRRWKGKDASRHDCYFTIDDEEFWHFAKHRELRVEIRDILKVQWAKKIVDKKSKETRVLKVLEFNGETLSKELDQTALNAILGDYNSNEIEDHNGNLFSTE